MPPRKKPRVGASAASTPVHTPAAATPAELETPTQPTAGTGIMILDPWTDEEEIALFKSVIRNKPVGMGACYSLVTGCSMAYAY